MTREELKEYQKEYQKEYRRKKREERKKRTIEKYKQGDVFKQEEEFREMKSFPGYFIGSYGTVISLKGYNGPRVLSQRVTKYGYKLVMLSLDGYPKCFQVARLVLATFVGYPADPWLCFVHHKDGDTTNCSLDNIEWLVCETDETYNPGLSHRRGVLKPDITKERMTNAKYKQTPETIEKAVAARRKVFETRGYWK